MPRKEHQFPYPNNSIFKMIRIRPASGQPSVVNAKIYPSVTMKEDYPPDIVPYTEPTDWGSPYQKNFTQLVLEVDTGGIAASVAVEVDGVIAQTISNVTTTNLDRARTLTLQSGVMGRRARLVNTAGSGGKFQLFNHQFITTPVDKGPVVHTFGWDDVGHPYDKRFYRMTIEYQVPQDVEMIVYGIRGIGGAQAENEVTRFTLQASGGNRKEHQFNFPDGAIYKMIRLIPASGTPPTGALIYAPRYQKEDYPADIVPYTEPTDWGSPYEKYFQQLTLEVDTGGVAASIQIEVDGTVVQTINGVTATQLDRSRTLTLNPEIKGRRARILNTAGASGKFQLFNHQFITLPADNGPVLHTFDWNDLGHPFDKRFKTVTIEYDTGGVRTEIILDTLGGPSGTVQNLDVQRFVLDGAARSLPSIALKDGIIAKMVRLHPAETTINFKHWRYLFDYEKLPQDIVPFTDWTDLGNPCEKILRNLVLDIDTGGVAATIRIQADGETKHSFDVSTTENDRSRIITLPSNIIGRRFRLLMEPGKGGKAQLFKYDFDRIIEPCPVFHWDSYEQYLGSNGFKFIKQIWVEYYCRARVEFKIYADDNRLLFSKMLPAQDGRNVYRFNVVRELNGVYNKSKSYRFTMDSASNQAPFKLYRDSSRVESMNLSGDQRQPYSQHYIFAQMTIPV